MSKAGRVGIIGGGFGRSGRVLHLGSDGATTSSCSTKMPWLGGKAAVLSESGFRFDMGPTILLMPSVLATASFRRPAGRSRTTRTGPPRPPVAVVLQRRHDP